MITPAKLSASDWEAMWAPYDEPTYQFAISQIDAQDVVLDIGAGDLRLARRLSGKARRVIAIERNLEVLERGLQEGALPSNLEILRGDARTLEFPRQITVGVLLMRHCQHYQLYVRKLKHAGAQRLITNARWRFGPEIIDLHSQRLPYSDLQAGWFACGCGATGFKSGPAEELTQEFIDQVVEVAGCPNCQLEDPRTDQISDVRVE